ncbi:ras GEF [Caulochytrium protostelioides]|uniref:Ras GEF n=1 Tax=Caulochytrium protostelioides TaxID=1555241 RepID=A0A4P9WYZ8_9FUNG|nr:ras GEF [Caulochytrium protostelioides]
MPAPASAAGGAAAAAAATVVPDPLHPTLDALLDRLTSFPPPHGAPAAALPSDPDFAALFLLQYRRFALSWEVLEGLVARFDAASVMAMDAAQPPSADAGGSRSSPMRHSSHAGGSAAYAAPTNGSPTRRSQHRRHPQALADDAGSRALGEADATDLDGDVRIDADADADADVDAVGEMQGDGDGDGNADQQTNDIDGDRGSRPLTADEHDVAMAMAAPFVAPLPTLTHLRVCQLLLQWLRNFWDDFRPLRMRVLLALFWTRLYPPTPPANSAAGARLSPRDPYVAIRHQIAPYVLGAVPIPHRSDLFGLDWARPAALLRRDPTHPAYTITAPSSGRSRSWMLGTSDGVPASCAGAPSASSPSTPSDPDTQAQQLIAAWCAEEMEALPGVPDFSDPAFAPPPPPPSSDSDSAADNPSPSVPSPPLSLAEQENGVSQETVVRAYLAQWYTVRAECLRASAAAAARQASQAHAADPPPPPPPKPTASPVLASATAPARLPLYTQLLLPHPNGAGLPPLAPEQHTQFLAALLNMDPSAVAESMTRLELRLFAAIRPRDLLWHLWSGAGHGRHYIPPPPLGTAATATTPPQPPLPHSRHPRIAASIAHFNRLSAFATRLVLTPSTPKQRAKVLAFLMRVCEGLVGDPHHPHGPLDAAAGEVRNFNSVMAVLSGMHAAAVLRLRHTLAILQQRVWVATASGSSGGGGGGSGSHSAGGGVGSAGAGGASGNAASGLGAPGSAGNSGSASGAQSASGGLEGGGGGLSGGMTGDHPSTGTGPGASGGLPGNSAAVSGGSGGSSGGGGAGGGGGGGGGNATSVLTSTTADRWRRLEGLMSSERSFRRLRAAVRAAGATCLPYLGVILRDVLYLDEANRDCMIETPETSSTTGGMTSSTSRQNLAGPAAAEGASPSPSASTPTSAPASIDGATAPSAGPRRKVLNLPKFLLLGDTLLMLGSFQTACGMAIAGADLSASSLASLLGGIGTGTGHPVTSLGRGPSWPHPFALPGLPNPVASSAAPTSDAAALDAHLAAWMQRLTPWTDEEAYARSLELEPRESREPRHETRDTRGGDSQHHHHHHHSSATSSGSSHGVNGMVGGGTGRDASASERARAGVEA